MAKPSILVDKLKLEKILTDLETKQSFSTLGSLFKQASLIYNKENGIENVTPSIVYLRVKQYNIPLKTKAGKPDLDKARQEKGKPEEDKVEICSKQTVSDLLMYADKSEKEKFAKLAKKVLKGSKMAAIKMHCLQCANWQPHEVRMCNILSCPMHAFRPYK